MGSAATLVRLGQAGSSRYSICGSLRSPIVPSTPPTSIVNEHSGSSPNCLDLDSPLFRGRNMQLKLVKAESLKNPSDNRILQTQAYMPNKRSGSEDRQRAVCNGNISEPEISPICLPPRRDALAEIPVISPEIEMLKTKEPEGIDRKSKLCTRRRQPEEGQKPKDEKLEEIASGSEGNPKVNTQMDRTPRILHMPKHSDNLFVRKRHEDKTPNGLAIQGLTSRVVKIEVFDHVPSPKQSESSSPDLKDCPNDCLQELPKSDRIMSMDLEDAMERSDSQTLGFVLTRRDRELVQDIVDEFNRGLLVRLMKKFDACCKLSSCAGNEKAADSLNLSTSSPQTSRVPSTEHTGLNSNKERSNKRRADSEDEEASEENEGRRNKRSKAASKAPKGYKCPFYVRAPEEFGSGKQHGCSAPFKDIPKLKEHIADRRHYIQNQCQRCKDGFVSSTKLDEHINAEHPCQSRPRYFKDGMSSAVYIELKHKKRTPEEEKWPEIYSLLFPGAPVPSRDQYLIFESASNERKLKPEGLPGSKFPSRIESPLPNCSGRRQTFQRIAYREIQAATEDIETRVAQRFGTEMDQPPSFHAEETPNMNMLDSPLPSRSAFIIYDNGTSQLPACDFPPAAFISSCGTPEYPQSYPPDWNYNPIAFGNPQLIQDSPSSQSANRHSSNRSSQSRFVSSGTGQSWSQQGQQNQEISGQGSEDIGRIIKTLVDMGERLTAVEDKITDGHTQTCARLAALENRTDIGHAQR